MIRRPSHIDGVVRRLASNPVVAVLGARQVGKTTLAGQVADAWEGPVVRFDLEYPPHLARLQEPVLALEGLRGLVVLDEIQRRPDLFGLLRVLADRPGTPARFLVLGSASPELLRQGSETLAGRIAFHELGGFALDEVGSERLPELWLRGGFPRSLLAADDREAAAWRRDFVRTFLERDVPQLGVAIGSETLRRFWTMLAHWHGQLWNGAELGRAFGVAHTTVRRYLDLLTATFVVRQLPAWHANLRKRQVKSPRIYLADPGLLHTLLGLETQEDLAGHPKVGASWEGFAMAEVIRRLGARREECFFWATHAGAELDLLVVRGQRRLGFEFKRTAAPRRTRSMGVARTDLELESITVVYPGDEVFPMGDDIEALGLARLAELKPL